jgi:recombination protein RecR
MFTPLVQQLIDRLRCLAGVGPKSAQRIAFQLLENNREPGLALGEILQKALIEVGHCERCQTFSEFPLCGICSNTSRDQSQLCIVETPTDVFALEQTHSFKGLYFVLMGHLSPIDGIGPDEIHISELKERLKKEPIEEIILATSATVEGEATAHYISTLVHGTSIGCSRIAHGIPLDGELGYLDAGTLSRALLDRTSLLKTS